MLNLFKKFQFLILALSMSASTAFADTYDFQTLWAFLGYSPEYFGASQQEVNSLDAYKDTKMNAYVRINGYLRTKDEQTLKNDNTSEEAFYIKNLDRLMQRTPVLFDDVILFRGMTLNWRDNKPFDIGEEYIDLAYSSTSTDIKKARIFAIPNGFGDPNNPTLGAVFAMYFQTSEGRGILIDRGEDEVLLQRGLRFRIMKKQNIRGRDHYLVQICQKALCDTDVKGRQDVLDFWNQLAN